MVLAKREKYDEALPFVQKAIDIGESIYGKKDKRLCKPIRILAMILEKQDTL